MMDSRDRWYEQKVCQYLEGLNLVASWFSLLFLSVLSRILGTMPGRAPLEGEGGRCSLAVGDQKRS